MVAETNAEVIAEFRANHGVVQAPYPDPPPMLLVHTIGRSSGREHVTPMRCLPEGDHWYVFASAHGIDRHPDWYRNLVANPDIAIDVGAETVSVRATVLEGDEREGAWTRIVAALPFFGDYATKVARQIPVFVLEPR